MKTASPGFLLPGSSFTSKGCLTASSPIAHNNFGAHWQLSTKDGVDEKRHQWPSKVLPVGRAWLWGQVWFHTKAPTGELLLGGLKGGAFAQSDTPLDNRGASLKSSVINEIFNSLRSNWGLKMLDLEEGRLCWLLCCYSSDTHSISTRIAWEKGLWSRSCWIC